MNKPVLLVGFPRSGTSFLYLKMLEKYRRVLYEPMNGRLLQYIKFVKSNKVESLSKIHPYFNKKQIKSFFLPYILYFGNKIEDIIIKYHPVKDGKNHVIFDYPKLIAYLKYFKGFHIKDVYLHVYIFDDWIQDNWNVYYIIRHPVDVFISLLKASGVYKRLRYKLYRIFKIRLPISFFDLDNIVYEVHNILGYGIGYVPNDTLYMFLVSYVGLNYYVLSKITSDRLIIYNKPKTYKNLPFKVENIKIKEYPYAREHLMYKFLNLSKKFGIEEEFNKILSLFD